MNKFTPIFGSSGIYTKHDFSFAMGGVCGTRGRMALAIVERLAKSGYKGVVYACGRSDVNVMGVTTKHEPYNVVARLLGVGVLDRPQVTFTYTRVKQVTSTNDVMYDGVALSPTSDGHCVKFLETGDMLWINGDNLAIDDINDIKE